MKKHLLYCCFFIVVKYTWPNIYHFYHLEVYSSVAFDTFTWSCSHHHHHRQSFASSQTETGSPRHRHSWFPLPRAPGHHHPTSFFPWIQLFQVPSVRCNAPKVYPCWGLCLSFLPFKAESCFLARVDGVWFIHSCVRGPSSWVHLLVNDAAVNVGVPTSNGVPAFHSFGYVPSGGIAGSSGNAGRFVTKVEMTGISSAA